MLITIDGKLYTDNGTLNFPDIFKQILQIFKHTEVESFKFNKTDLIIEFKTQIPVNVYSSQLNTFSGYADIKLAPKELHITLKTEKKVVTTPEKTETKTTPKHTDNKVKKFNPDDYIIGLANDDDNYKVINVTKKLSNIQKGTYIIKFDTEKYGWVLIYTQSGKRIPVKQTNTVVDIFEKAKSISPIAPTTKK